MVSRICLCLRVYSDIHTRMSIYQVVRQWHGMETETMGGDAVTEIAAARFKEICDAANGIVAKRTKKDLVAKHQSNQLKVVACDRVLFRGTGIKGLKHFVGSDVAPLPAGARRYFVPVEDMPHAMREQSGGRLFRSCIELPSGEKRLEVRWSKPRPSLWQLLDMGSKGWYSKMATTYELKARGSEIPCAAHRRVRNRELALTASRLGWVCMEWRIVQAWIHGPFDSSANYAMLKESLTEYVKSFSPADPWFRSNYERIVMSKTRGVAPIGYGTEEHYNKTSYEMLESPLMKKMKDSVGELFLAVGYMCITRGFFAPSELPGYRRHIDPTATL